MSIRQEKCGWNAGLVSIVTPVYNGEAHLPKMLDSVLLQTYLQIEMILVDDGSTDGTIGIAESYREKFADRGYSYRIVQAPHKNASAAINRGLPYVTGEYLIWPDSDDVLEPESVAKRVAFLQTHPQYDCVRSLFYSFDLDTGERNKNGEQIGNTASEELFWNLLEGRTFVHCGCYMLKTAGFFEIYPERKIPEYEVGQNFQMLLPFMFRHKCPTIREELYGYAVRSGSHSRRKLTRAQEEKRYGDFERLVDEIAIICQIDDKQSLDRITVWKERRRYELSLKYGRIKEAFRAMRGLYECGELNICQALKEAVWICFIHSWIGERLYASYRRWRC